MNSLVNRSLERVHHLLVLFSFDCLLTDRLHQVRLSQTHPSVDKKWVIPFGRRLRNREGGCVGKLITRSHDKRFKPIARIHPVVDNALRILIMGFRGQRLAHPVRMGIECLTDRSDICATEFDLWRTPEHGHRRGSHDIQIITLDPELIYAVRNLKGQRDFIRLHQFN